MHVEAISVDDGLLGIVHHPTSTDGEGCAIVVHGAASDCFDGLIWTICRDLAARGIRTAAVNLSARGLGRYAESLRSYRGWPWTPIDEAAAEVAAFSERCADQFGQPFAMIGHSWGALLATLASPVTRPKRLTLISPMVSPRTMVKNLYPDIRQAVADAEERSASGRGAELILSGTGNPASLSAAIIVDYFHYALNGIADVIANLDHPVRVVVGGREHHALLAGARDLANRASDGRLTVIDGAGHFFVGRRKELVNALAQSA